MEWFVKAGESCRGLDSRVVARRVSLRLAWQVAKVAFRKGLSRPVQVWQARRGWQVPDRWSRKGAKRHGLFCRGRRVQSGLCPVMAWMVVVS